MRTRFRWHGRYVFLFVGFGFTGLLAGCGSSVQSGTQVQMSEETKAQIANRKALYKSRDMQKATSATKGKSAQRR